MAAKRWMIYGAYGYTGELIAREAATQGMTPVLAGRDAARVEALATELELETRTFALADADTVAAALADIDLLLNCAGPFSATAAQAMAACVAAGTHYLDISGEIDVFETAFEHGPAAGDAGVVLCPGVGFDVIPTDCVAAILADALPDATHLALGFDSDSGFSPGTAKTAIEGLAAGGKLRRDGRIVTVALAANVRVIDFGNGTKTAITIPWGDVATAWHSTGIGNIEVYMPVSPRLVKRLKQINRVRRLLAAAPVQSLLQARIGRTVKGPDAATRDQQPTRVWGEARNARGATRVARVKTANGYTVTVHGSLAVVRHLLEANHKGGAYTPSRLMGKQLVESLPGSTRVEISA